MSVIEWPVIECSVIGCLRASYLLVGFHPVEVQQNLYCDG